jgi:AAA family ATP:ADP antiporter
MGMYPDDTDHALKSFAAFMGLFGILTNSISFLFSLLGTGKFIQAFGLAYSLIAFPAIMLMATAVLYVTPDIWTTLGVMMLMKALGYALNNPAKEILYQATSTDIKFKCKSWIDTFGQRSAKAAGSLVTNACAESMADLINYGTVVGIFMSTFLVWVAQYMGRTFDELQAVGSKVGEGELPVVGLAAVPVDTRDRSDESSARQRLVSGDDDESESGDI